MDDSTERKRRESKQEVQTFIEKLRYALADGKCKVDLITQRTADRKRNKRYTNRYTLALLFPDELGSDVLRRELPLLTIEDYIETVKDIKCPKLSEWRVFGKQYCNNDVYIKFRVELIDRITSGTYILVISFHFSEWDFKECDYPYKKN